MVRVEHSALIRAPRERVWAILTDYEGYPRTFPGITSVRNVHREGDRTSFELDQADFGTITVKDLVVTPQKIEREIATRRLHGQVLFSLQEAPEGTKFRIAFDVMPKGFLRLLAPLMKGRVRRVAEQNVTNLKKAAEVRG